MKARFARSARLAREWVIIAILTIGGLIGLSQSGLADRWNNAVYDWLVRQQPPDATLARDVLIVAIDEQALLEIGPWPWDRSVHAKIVEHLQQAGARSILFDILFLDPAGGDSTFSQAMEQAGNVTLPYRIEAPGLNGEIYDLEQPVPVLEQASAATGHVMVSADRDGVIRSLDRYYRIGSVQWPHIAVATAAAFPSAGENGATEPATTLERPLIGFSAPPGGFSTVSASALLNDEVPAAVIEGRDVLVGSTAAGLGDFYATPFGDQGQLMRGVELTANALVAQRQGLWISKLSRAMNLVLAIALVLLVLIAFVRLRARAALALSFTAMAGLILASAILLQLGYWFAPVAPLIALALSGPVWAWRRLAQVDDFMEAELVRLGAEAPAGADMPLQSPLTDPIGHRIGQLQHGLSQLRDMRSSLEQVIDYLPDATMVINRDGKIARVNRAMIQMVDSFRRPGFSPAMPQTLDDLNTLFDEAGTSEIQHLADLDRLQAEQMDEEAHPALELATPDDRHFLAAAEGVPGRDVLIVTFVEISVLRRALREKERALQFLSHDLRSPIASGLALLDGIKSEEPDRHAQMEMVRRPIQRALDLASSYVLLAKAEEGNLSRSEFDLVGCLEEVMDVFWPLSQSQGIKIESVFPEQELVIEADRVAITRSVENLLRNAIEHGAGKGDTIRVKAQEKGANVRICVEDGDGGSVASIAGAIAAYQRTGTLSSGTGLGLAYCVTVMRRHGGTLQALPVATGKALCLDFPRGI
ncbi:MAG: CHASE2 domain-containing protein [Sphingomonadaceae bacterium]